MGPSGEVLIPFNPSAPDSDTMMVSGGVSELEDISGSVGRLSRAVLSLNPMWYLVCRVGYSAVDQVARRSLAVRSLPRLSRQPSTA